MKVSCSLGDLDTLLRIQLSECGMGEDGGGNSCALREVRGGVMERFRLYESRSVWMG